MIKKRDSASTAAEHLRALPSVEAWLQHVGAQPLIQRFGREAVINALRSALEVERQAILDGAARDCRRTGDFAPARIEALLTVDNAPRLRRVINATGVALHTNLGRAPLAPEAIEAIAQCACGYSNLEFDLESGKRGSRHDLIEDLLCTLTGAQAALVVNNCAAAVTLALAAHANAREVICWRGELIEIGGSFRMPDVVRQSGAQLVEIGATNKVHLRDYQAALSAESALVLKSHSSNFRMVGFVSSPSIADLTAFAHENGLLVLEDLGSGVLVDLVKYGLPAEPTVQSRIADGVDMVCFSGDKLLGGPQAGIICGTREALAPLRRHPLARALRIDKLSLAALQATLRLYRPPNDPVKAIPLLAALTAGFDALDRKAKALAERINELGNLAAVPQRSQARAGGGSLPEQDIPSACVGVVHQQMNAQQLADALRRRNIPIICRIAHNQLLIDMRTLMRSDDDEIVAAFTEFAAA